MNTLIVIGVLLMLAAVVVMYRQWRIAVDIAAELATDNHRLRNDLHAAMNARKAKSRGRLGQYRIAAAALFRALEESRDFTAELDALRNIVDSEVV